jgi:hypothetical protein
VAFATTVTGVGCGAILGLGDLERTDCAGASRFDASLTDAAAGDGRASDGGGADGTGDSGVEAAAEAGRDAAPDSGGGDAGLDGSRYRMKRATMRRVCPAMAFPSPSRAGA